MPLTRIEMEQVERDRWVATCEIGGLGGSARRVTVRGQSFEEIMTAVNDAWCAFTPKPFTSEKARIEREQQLVRAAQRRMPRE